MNSLFDFYKELFELSDLEFRNQIPIVNSNKVRAELFKLNYDRNQFALNEKVDAFEAFNQILSIIHVWAKTFDLKVGAGISLSQGI